MFILGKCFNTVGKQQTLFKQFILTFKKCKHLNNTCFLHKAPKFTPSSIPSHQELFVESG